MAALGVEGVGVEEAGAGCPLATRARSVFGASGLPRATGRRLALGTEPANIQPQSSQKAELFLRGVWQLGQRSGAASSTEGAATLAGTASTLAGGAASTTGAAAGGA